MLLLLFSLAAIFVGCLIRGEGLIIIYGELSCPGAAFFGGELTPQKRPQTMRSNHSGNDGCNFFKPVFFYVSVGFIQIREG